jgi:hypothetical protein
VYYTYHFLAETIGIELAPVNSSLLLDGSEELRLPEEPHQWLLLSDPIWFAGRNVSDHHVCQIAVWQERTGGTVLVDGAFQYQRWSDNHRPERTSQLDPSRTVRNICPTKAAAVHGVRFAYALIPSGLREELRYCYSNVAGSGSVYDKYAAHAMMSWLTRNTSNRNLLDFVSRRHTSMVETGLLADPIGADASYFCFVRVPVSTSRLVSMGQTFFDTVGYPGFVRFNLLLPESELRAYVRLAVETAGVDCNVEDLIISGQMTADT